MPLESNSNVRVKILLVDALITNSTVRVRILLV